MYKLITFIYYLINKYYFLSVAILSIILINFEDIWLLSSFLTFSSLIFVKDSYLKEKKMYFLPLFNLNSKNFIINLIIKFNIYFAIFLTCTSFFVIDFLAISLAFLMKKLK